MSKTFVKLIEGRLKYLTNIPGVWNPTEKMVATYAAEHGYKELVHVDQPGRFYNKSYKDLKNTVKEVWTAWDLQVAKDSALNEAQSTLDMNLAQRTTVGCTGFDAGIVYDQNALTNAMGLEAGDMFIDAADGVHVLTEENIIEIKKSLKGHRMSLYTKVTTVRAAIAAAETVDEVEAALGNLA